MNINMTLEEEKYLNKIITEAISRKSKFGEKCSIQDFEKYILENYFNPRKRDKTIFDEAINLPDLNDFDFDDQIVDIIVDKGLVIKSGTKLLPTPLGIRVSVSRFSEIDSTSLIKTYQDILSEKFKNIYSLEQKILNKKEMAPFIFLLYNNHTSKERGDIGDFDLAKIIDKITDSFVKGRMSKGTRSLNGRPGGGYFVIANKALGYPAYMKKPHYYIKNTEINRVRSILKDSIQKQKSFNSIESFEAFEEMFNQSIDILLKKKALFATNESKRDVRKLFYGGN